ncbi:uncharacterized protein LOC144634161 [Oculina patagonica]
MMYLRIVLIACISFGLVQSDQGLAKQDYILQCPNCLVQGDLADAEASCVKVTKIKPCREPQPVCAQITAPGVFQRLCASQAEFDNFKASCEIDNSCQVVEVSSPPAPRPSLTENEGLAKQDDILQCPNCLVQGEQADAEASCVKVAEIKPCREPQPVCAQITGPGVFQRLCVSQAEFDNFKASCDTDNSCQVVEVSSPPAPLPSLTENEGLAKQDDILQCPNCLVQGEQADAEASCVKVTEIKPCRETQPVCAQITGPGVFQRLCVSQAEFDNFKASCEVDNSCQVAKLSSPPAPRQ